MADETSDTTVELRGQGLDNHVGHRIQIMGTMITGESADPPRTRAKEKKGFISGHGGNAIVAGVVIATAVGTTVGVIATSDVPPNVSPTR